MTLLTLLYAFLALPLLTILKRIIDTLIDRKGILHFPSLTPLCAYTNLGYILHNYLARRQGTIRSEALHEVHKHHLVIRIGPNRLSFASVAAVQAIYGTKTPCVKGDQYTTPGGAPNILSVVDKQQHAVKRKRLSKAFATSHLLDWEYKVRDKVDRLIGLLERRCETGEVVDFRWMSNLFTLDAIMDIALSHRSDFMERGSDVVLAEAMDGSRREVKLLECLRAVNRANEPIVWSSTAFPALKTVARVVPACGRQWRLAETWKDVVRSVVHQRLQQEDMDRGTDDLFSCLLKDGSGNELNLEKGEIMAETSHLMDAGSDTTSIALTHVVYFLAKHPECLAKLRTEIETSVKGTPSNESLAYAQVGNLPYLQACLNEAMRLRPALSAGLQRRTPPEGMSISGEWIAGNTLVSVPAYTVHRDPIVFPEPEAFRPERWIDEKAKSFQKYILTFSAGGRVCIGKNITYLEQSLLVAEIVRKFDFELPDENWEMEWEEHFNLWPKCLPLKFSRRDGTSSW